MITLLVLAEPGITDSPYAGPGAVVVAGLALLAAAAKYYKDARYADVERERDRRVSAETREKEVTDSTQVKVDELTKRIDSLERKIDELRESNEEKIEQLRADHEQDLLAERNKLVAERTRSFKLRLLLSDHGVEIPEELR